MDKNGQDEIKKYFDSLYQAGVTPWKDHPAEPALTYFLKYLKDRQPKAIILDIGCGDGWISIKAAKASFEVWGIDGSDTAIASARWSAREAGVEDKTHFQVGDALALPYDDAFFGALIDRGLFHHILPKNRTLYLENVLRVLKKKSFVYLAVFSKKNPIGIGQRFIKQDILDLFGSHFRLTYFNEDPFPTPAPAHLFHFILKRNQ